MFLEFECATSRLLPSGPVEHTDLTDIDRAVASFISSIIQTWQLTDVTRAENKEFGRFLEREPNKQLYVGEFESHEDFLRKLSGHVQKSSKTTTTDDAQKMVRNEMLPAMYISRDGTFIFDDTGEHNDETWSQQMSGEKDGEEVIIGMVNKSYPHLTYSITVLTWEKSTISRISTALTMWLRHTKIGRKHVFKAKTKIAGAPYELNVYTQAARGITGTPEPVNFGEKRIWGQTFAIEFISEFVEVEAVDEQKIRLAFNQEFIR